MRTISLTHLALLASLAFAGAQAEPIDGAPDPSTEPAATSGAARLVGEIPDGRPPPPAQPKPEYQIAEGDVVSTTSHRQGGRTITIREIRPIALPAPPAPVEVPPAEEISALSRGPAEIREAGPRGRILCLGATVYRSNDRPPCSLVRWWPQGGEGPITFWSSADFALIAGGIACFQDTNGAAHSLIVNVGDVDIDRASALHAAKGRDYNRPALPDFPANSPTFAITGDHLPDAVELVVIQSLHEVYHRELERLRSAKDSRERARIERDAHLKTHPPQPEDITLNFWRTEKPAPEEKGGAR